MKRFIVRTFCILLPFIGVFCAYIISDPLHVIWEYDDYTITSARNAAYNSYKLLTKEDSITYNSFIVGSSRSGHWPWREWELHLDSTAKAFHLDSSGDIVYNAWERLNFVYKNVKKVDNILLIVDHSWLTGDSPSTDLNVRTPWQMRENKDYFAFQRTALSYFFSIKGLKEHYKIGPQYTYRLPSYRDERHEPHNIGMEWAIKSSPEYYYGQIVANNSPYKMNPRDSVEQLGEPVITKKGIELLSRIHNLFVEGNTNYKIVISPLYDQIKLNPQDKNILDSIFGYENVYDYSGINEYTNDTLNYYEGSHYRPSVATSIMNEIYTP